MELCKDCGAVFDGDEIEAHYGMLACPECGSEDVSVSVVGEEGEIDTDDDEPF